MATFNAGDLRDDYALASSLRIGFQTEQYKGLSLTANYRIFAIHAYSRDLWLPEPRINQLNRYETGLFDLNNPESRYFGKIEELHLKYEKDGWEAKIGRMVINTPFINTQDGRLNPTSVEGLQLGGKIGKNLQVNSYQIWRIGLRSSGNWTGIGSSIGVYPVGLDEAGNRSQYFGNTHSRFISMFQLKYKLGKSQLQFWNTLIDNISNTALVEYSAKTKLNDKNHLLHHAMVGFQNGLGEGGNEDPALRYKNPDDWHVFLSLQSGIENQRFLWTINYTHLSGKGRFLSPREWGRDPFYTFMPRERNEGYAFVNATTSNFEAKLLNGLLKPGIGYGFFFLPDASDAAANKYAFPSYRQLNASLKVQGKGNWKNMDGMLLLVRKTAMQKEIDRLGWVYNKVNLSHVNLIINYRF